MKLMGCSKEGVVAKFPSDRISAGGYIVQLLPGATEDTIDMVELNIAKVLMQYNANGAAELLQKGVHPAQMVEELMTDLEPGMMTPVAPSHCYIFRAPTPAHLSAPALQPQAPAPPLTPPNTHIPPFPQRTALPAHIPQVQVRPSSLLMVMCIATWKGWKRSCCEWVSWGVGWGRLWNLTPRGQGLPFTSCTPNYVAYDFNLLPTSRDRPHDPLREVECVISFLVLDGLYFPNTSIH